MLDNNLKRYFKLGALVLLLAALLGPYIGLHLVSAPTNRSTIESETDQPLPAHNPIPIPSGLKQLSREHPTNPDGSPGKLSEIEDLLGSANVEKQQPVEHDGQN